MTSQQSDGNRDLDDFALMMESSVVQDEVFEENQEMDTQSRNALLRCRNKILQDLEVSYIIDCLIENRVVDMNFCDQIKAKVS